MAVPARKIESGDFMEERVARLEVKVDHLQADVTEIKARMSRQEEKLDGLRESVDKKIDGLRESLESKIAAVDKKIDGVREFLEEKIDGVRESLEEKIDGVRESLEEKIDGVRESLEEKIDAIMDSISSLKVSRWVDRVWWLVIAGGMFGGLLGVMARGFKWI